MLIVWRGLGFIIVLLVVAAVMIVMGIDEIAPWPKAPKWALNGGVWALAALFNGVFA
jgi:hypothetical protein